MEPCAPLTICTMRPSVLLRRCAEAEIPLRVLSPQPLMHGPLEVLPSWTPPYLIDAVEMPLPLLAALLAAAPPPRRTRRRVRRKLVGVLLEPEDVAARQLAALTRGVSLLISDELGFERLLPWVRHFPAIRPVYGVIALGVPPVHPLPLPEPFLRVFAVLPHAASMSDVAERCRITRRTVQRVLASTREVLGLPEGRRKRFLPATLADEFTQALRRTPLVSLEVAAAAVTS